MTKKIRAWYRAGRREDIGKYYYGTVKIMENGKPFFSIKYGKTIVHFPPLGFEEVKQRA